MANIFNFHNDEKPRFPVSSFSVWNDLRLKYETDGYNFMDFDTCTKSRVAKKMDEKNMKIFNNNKKYENRLRSSVKKLKMPTVKAAPSPSNYERLKQLRIWRSERSSFDISMATALLLKKFNMMPCIDYEPHLAVETYLSVTSERCENTFKFGEISRHKQDNILTENFLKQTSQNNVYP